MQRAPGGHVASPEPHGASTEQSTGMRTSSSPSAPTVGRKRRGVEDAVESKRRKRSLPPPGQCHFWHSRKQRWCNFSVAKFDSKFCHHHTDFSSLANTVGGYDRSNSAAGKKSGVVLRSRCDYCKSWVITKRMQTHLKKCPAHLRILERCSQPYYHENINSGEQDEGGDENKERKGKAMQQQHEIDDLAIVCKLEKICKNIAAIKTETSLCASCARFCPSDKGRGWKHFKQQSSILARLQSRGVLEARERGGKDARGNQQQHRKQEQAQQRSAKKREKMETDQPSKGGGRVVEKGGGGGKEEIKEDEEKELDQQGGGGATTAIVQSPIVFLEMGAGKGGLASLAAMAFKCDVVMVDLGTFQNSQDSISSSSSNVFVECEYVMVMIKGNRDVEREALPGCIEASLRVNMISCTYAHLPPAFLEQLICAASERCATDFALRALSHEDRESRSGTKGLTGIAIATCCHHRCEWASYVGKEYLIKVAGIDKQEFAKVCQWASWATNEEMHHTGSKRSSRSSRNRNNLHTYRSTNAKVEEIAQQDSSRVPTSEVQLRASEGQLRTSACEKAPNHSPPEHHHQRPPSQSFHHWTRAEKKRIGMLSKRALDKGREWFLKSQLGMETEFVAYVEDSTSLENRLLMAFPSVGKSSALSRRACKQDDHK
eukprot:jgi/Bigna1/69502/fgenesh1_pg.9_\